MSFDRDFLGRPFRDNRSSALADIERMELVDVAALRIELANQSLAVHRTAERERPGLLLDQALLMAEIARRTGEAVMLARSAHATERALRGLKDPRQNVAGRLLLAAIGVRTAQLYNDPAAADAALARLAQLDADATLIEVERVTALGLKGRLLAHKALAENDLNGAVEAAGVLDEAVRRADVKVRKEKMSKAEAANLRLERAELLIGFGAQLKDDRLLIQAEADMTQLSARLDRDRLPISWSRSETLRGAALLALGELEADPLRLQAGVERVSFALNHLPHGHSPLDSALSAHTLGLGLTSLGEVADDEALFGRAINSFEEAILAFDTAPDLAQRAVVAYDRASAILRRAERAGDEVALLAAEALFRSELTAINPRKDAASWAVIQMALARVYRVRDLIQGGCASRGKALMALNEALDVFVEKGMKSLADIALSGVEDLKAASV